MKALRRLSAAMPAGTVGGVAGWVGEMHEVKERHGMVIGFLEPQPRDPEAAARDFSSAFADLSRLASSHSPLPAGTPGHVREGLVDLHSGLQAAASRSHAKVAQVLSVRPEALRGCIGRIVPISQIAKQASKLHCTGCSRRVPT